MVDKAMMQMTREMDRIHFYFKQVERKRPAYLSKLLQSMVRKQEYKRRMKNEK